MPIVDRASVEPDPATQDPLREQARLYVRQLRAFYIHAGVFAGSMVIIFLVNLAVNVAANLTGEWRAWWSVWALLGWGLGVMVHGFVVLISRPRSLGSSWEDQQIEKLLAQDEAR